MSTEPFVYVTYIASSAEKVWKALMDNELTRQYWQHEHVTDWSPGANWKLVGSDGRNVKHVGRVVENVPSKRLVLTWGEATDAWEATTLSRVTMEIEPMDDMVKLTITHSDLSPDMRRRISGGWPLVCSSLKSMLETGRPLDF